MCKHRHSCILLLSMLIALSTYYCAWGQLVGRDTLTFVLMQEGQEVQYPAEVPGTIQGTLLKHGAISHPFVGTLEDSIAWVSDSNWIYFSTFELSEAEISDALVYRLNLSEIQTYGEVYLNGALVGRTDNEFVDYSFEVKDYLRVGTNRLAVRLLSTTREAHLHYLSNGFNYPADNDRAEKHYSVYVRKPQYQFGWDWGPRIITMGIGAPIILQAVRGCTFTNLYVRSAITFDHNAPPSPKECAIIVSFSLISPEGKSPKNGVVDIELIDPETNSVVIEKQLRGEKDMEISLPLIAPKLWMPNGLGTPFLYTLRITYRDGEYSTTIEKKVGVRDIRLDRSKDAFGEAFLFIVNGQKLYIKGANYLPHDRTFGGGGRTLEDLFTQDFLPAHYNMVRLWGGGRYETEEFYDLADRYGILVWQDLPFACSTYPNDPDFRRNVSAEWKTQLTRLRNHPSLALLCGNNEVLEGYKHWGWKKKYGYSDEVWHKMREDYTSFFEHYASEEILRYVPHVEYIHGSPLSSNWGRPESLLFGDAHYWGVWFGGEDFTTFDRNYGRFASEFGFQSFPEIKTIRAFAPGADDIKSIDAPILKHRQRSFIGNGRITEYMQREYPVPSIFEDYVYVGQVLQAKGMAYSLRAIRRGFPINMGLLYWQYNDVWPTVSWSSVDYYGNHKAMHYGVRDAYAPYLIDLVQEGTDSLALWVVSDRQEPHSNLVADMTFCTFEGDTIGTKKVRVGDYSAPFANRIESGLQLSDIFHGYSLNSVYVHLRLRSGQLLLAERLFYPSKPKDLVLQDIPPEVKTQLSSGKCVLTLSSPILVKDLFIETPLQGARFSDNFFDLLPGEVRTITITHSDISKDKKLDIKLTSMNQILNKYRK